MIIKTTYKKLIDNCISGKAPSSCMETSLALSTVKNALRNKLRYVANFHNWKKVVWQEILNENLSIAIKSLKDQYQ